MGERGSKSKERGDLVIKEKPACIDAKRVLKAPLDRSGGGRNGGVMAGLASLRFPVAHLLPERGSFEVVFMPFGASSKKSAFGDESAETLI